MTQTIEGIDTLQSRLQELAVMLDGFRSRPNGSAVSDSTSSRLERLNEWVYRPLRRVDVTC